MAANPASTSRMMMDLSTSERPLAANNNAGFVNVYVNNIENLSTPSSDCVGDWKDLISYMKQEASVRNTSGAMPTATVTVSGAAANAANAAVPGSSDSPIYYSNHLAVRAYAHY